MDGIGPWNNLTMDTLIPDPNALVGAVKNRLGECVLGTEVGMDVDDSLLSKISAFGATFTINDVELKNNNNNNNNKLINSGIFTNSPSDLIKRNRRESDDTNPEFFCDSTLASEDLSNHTPLPPFHHFRLPPPPHPCMITPHTPHTPTITPDTESCVTFGVGSVSATCLDVVDSTPFHSDVVHAESKPSFTLTSCVPPSGESKSVESKSGESQARSRSKLTNCSSAPSSMPPFKGKGTNSRLFSQDRRRATLHNPAAPESWISPESALLTVLTRDLYPPPCELVSRPPNQTDLEKYYAVFLPKNLSDDYAEGVVEGKASSIPSLLGRSASTESLHKDRLLPLLDDFFDCGDLEFSTRKIFRSSDSLSLEDSADDCSRQSFSADVDGVGFYLASGSPPGNLSRSPRAKMTEQRWSPYFGDPKDSQGQLPSVFPFLDSPSLVSFPSLSSQHNQKQLSSSRLRSDPSNIKRSRSAEPTKVDQRNDKAKKYLRVRFADSEGKDLAKTKDFRKTDDLKIPTRVLEPLRPGIERGLPAVGVRHFYAKNFAQSPLCDEEVQKLVKERKVVLNGVNIAPDLVIGSVVVGNVSSEHKKNVFVRSTYNDWNSFIDVAAGHLSCDETTSTSRFSFSLGIPRDFVKGDVLEFAVGYTGMGRIYWDNNDGNNYIIECFARQCPLHSEDRSWISFI